MQLAPPEQQVRQGQPEPREQQVKLVRQAQQELLAWLALLGPLELQEPLDPQAQPVQPE